MTQKRYDIGPPYLIQYRHNGSDCAFTMGADDWDDAQSRLRSIGFNGEVVGSGVEIYRQTTLNAFPLSLWIRLTVWWRNLWQDRP